MSNIKIEDINVFELEVPSYDEKELSLLINVEEDFQFNSETDFIEAKIYDESKNLIHSSGDYYDGGIYRNYSVINNEIELNVEDFIESLGLNTGTYFTIYNFYRKICSNNNLNVPEYFIKQIDNSRTEISLALKEGYNEDVLKSIKDFIKYRENSNKFIDFIISFGSDNFLATNIKVNELDETEVFVKLYEPLSLDYDINSQLLFLLELNSPKGYRISIENEIQEINNNIPLNGPNFNIENTSYSATETKDLSLDEINSSGIIELKQQLESYLADSKHKLNIDYSKFENFIHFSSAFKRFYNFIQKIKLIQFTGFAFEGKENDIISSFDGYEYYLFNNEYPRDLSGNLIPFLNNTSQPESDINHINPMVISWYEEFSEKSLNYDDNNLDYLYWGIPEYLREDPQNYPYRLFIEMIGHMFDDIWVYIRSIQNLYKGDNRSDFGISKDLLTKLLNNFGFKLYNGNFSNQDLYTTFLGTKKGELPYKNMTLETPGEDEEYIEYYIDVPEGEMPLNDIEYRIFKRLYHNLPYLYKGRGTVNVLRTILNIYGIPEGIISINEFGKKEKISDNNPSILGTTLSPTESLQQAEYSDTINNKFNKYIEIGVSPQDQINNFIRNNIGEINLGEIIGDVRNFKKGGNSYIKLEEFRNDFMQSYVEAYDLVDFIRLAKFLNNSLFKTLKDFVPANTTISSGIIIKQHDLERNKTNPLEVDLIENTYETLMKSPTRDYNEYDPNYPVNHRTKGSSIELVSGGTGGSLEEYNNITNLPYYANNEYGQDQLIQAWEEKHKSVVGLVTEVRDSQREFYDGEYGKAIEQKSPEICRTHFSNEFTKDFRYKILFVGDGIDITNESGFLSSGMSTDYGHMEIFIKEDDQSNRLPKMAKYIKINRYSTNNANEIKFDIGKFIKTNEFLNLFLNGVKVNKWDEDLNLWKEEGPIEGNFKFTFYNVIELFNEANEIDGYLIILNQNETDKVTGYYDSSSNSSSIIFKASGDFVWRTNGKGVDWNLDSIFNTHPQGYFPPSLVGFNEYKTQFIRGYSKSSFFENENLTSTNKNAPIGNSADSFEIYHSEKDGDAYNGLEYVGPLVKSTPNILPWFSNGDEGLIKIDSNDFIEMTPQQSGNGPITFLGAEFDIISIITSLKHNIKVTFPNVSPLNPPKLIVSTIKAIPPSNPPTMYFNTTPPSGIDENVLGDDTLDITLENAIVPNIAPGEYSTLKTTIFDKVGAIIGTYTGSPDSTGKNFKLIAPLSIMNNIGRIETYAYRPQTFVSGKIEIVETFRETGPGSEMYGLVEFDIKVKNGPYTGKINLTGAGHRDPGGGTGGPRIKFELFENSPYYISKAMVPSFTLENNFDYFNELEVLVSNVPEGTYKGTISVIMTTTISSFSSNYLSGKASFLLNDGTPAGILNDIEIIDFDGGEYGY